MTDIQPTHNSKNSLDWMHPPGMLKIENLNLSTCTALSGELPPLALALLLEGKANLTGAGSLSLPSNHSLMMASDLLERIQNVAETVDLRRDTIGFSIKVRFAFAFLSNSVTFQSNATNIFHSLSQTRPGRPRVYGAAPQLA